MADLNLSKRSRYGLYSVASLLLAFALVLVGQLFYLQIFKGNEYKQLAGASHFQKRLTYPVRGKIESADGDILAMTTYKYTIGITPASVVSRPPSFRNEQGKIEKKDALSQKQIEEDFARMLSLPQEEVQQAFSKRQAPYVLLKKEMDKEDYDPFQKYLEEYGISGVAVDSLPKRFYPQRDLAAQVIGLANRSGETIQGVTGIEAYYERELAGKPGYTYGEVDHYFGGQLPYSNPTEVQAEPGHNVVLNINSKLQKEAQEIVERYSDLFQALDGGVALVLDGKTGAVLAMAQDTSMDLNQPYKTPSGLKKGARALRKKIFLNRGDDREKWRKEKLEELEKNKEKLLEEEKKLEPGIRVQGPVTPLRLLQLYNLEDRVENPDRSLPPAGKIRDPQYQYKGWDPFHDRDDLDFLYQRVWQNRSVSYTYEPGSTMKSFTVATALEEHAFDLNERFSDSPIWIRGFGDYAIHCHIFPDNHGYETVDEAFGNSCNPVMVQLAERVGVDKFYSYLHALGFFDLTHVDLPAESYGILHRNPTVVDLAPMSFGESNTITPLMLAAAYTSFVNEGEVMKPRIAKSIQDDEGHVLKDFPPEVAHRVYSQATVQNMRAMLRSAVTHGIVNLANEPGYMVGGKTGTSTTSTHKDKVEDYSVMSVASVFPIDEPRYVVLTALFGPNTETTACVQSMTRDLVRATGRICHVPKRYTPQDLQAALKESNLAYENGVPLQVIADYLAIHNVNYDLQPGMHAGDTFSCIYPLGGRPLNGYPIYYVSHDGNPTQEELEVPDFKGKTFEEAAELARQKEINIHYNGNPLGGVVVSQDVPVQQENGEPNKMRKYEVIELTFDQLPGYNPPQIRYAENPVTQNQSQLPIQTDPIWTTQIIYSPYGGIPEHNPYGG